ncbi:hypothetical protein T01_3315 [Trichinella spiralis]|uniref:Uncharacterized protein n=1 Tax=Trichinella spiralis TaxID=6334 RepID=A0A0V1AVG1_TRISP|nr:hypothetical protein T01_3315 [Trichinella spiralis]
MNGNFSLQMLLPAINGSSKLKLGLYTHAWWCIFKLVNRIWLLGSRYSATVLISIFIILKAQNGNIFLFMRQEMPTKLNMPNKMMHGSCDRRSRNRLATVYLNAVVKDALLKRREKDFCEIIIDCYSEKIQVF